MSTMKRAVVTVDGTDIQCIEAHYVVTRTSNPSGRRIGDSMRANAFFWAELGDTARNDADKVIRLWEMATETTDPLHRVEIAYYDEDAGKRLQTVKFQGWLSRFETFTPALDHNVNGNGSGNGQSPNLANYKHVLFCELTVVLDDKNISKHELTK
jgi:hypothetical protein